MIIALGFVAGCGGGKKESTPAHDPAPASSDAAEPVEDSGDTEF